MKHSFRTLRSLVSICIAACATTAISGDTEDMIARGAYLVTIMDCAGCHMPRGSDGVPIFEAGLSGGTVGFEIPGMGIFWPPNLTQGKSGLGAWSDDEIAAAITGGLRPDGRTLVPVMPWPAYAGLAQRDVDALVAYLRSLPVTEAPRFEPVTDPSAAVAPFYRVVLPANGS